EDLAQPRQPRRWRGIVRIGFPFRLADDVADCPPNRRLGDEINVSVGILLPALAFEDPAWLAAAGIVAGARHGVAEGHAFAILAVFGQRTVLESLLVAQLDPAKIEHTVLHGGEHPLAAAGADALIKRRNDPKREMQTSAGIADLRAGDERRAVAEAGSGRRAAGTLRHVLVDFAVLIGAGPEALHRGNNPARVHVWDRVP